MSELGRAIREAAVSAARAEKPADVFIGKVLSVAPLTVKLDQKRVLTAEFLTMCESLTELKIEIGDTSYTLRHGPTKDDSVVLLRAGGGQHYYIIDRVVTNNAAD